MYIKMKIFFNKIKVWYNNRIPQDYYDPFSGVVCIAKKKNQDNTN